MPSGPAALWMLMHLKTLDTSATEMEECFLFSLSVCGVAPLNNITVGGPNAAPGSWPWQVSLQTSGVHFCSGSLINSNWVLTAARCLISNITERVTVYLGLQSLSTSDANTVSRSVTQVIGYPNLTYERDIVLLKLNSSVNFTDYIKPVCLAAAGSAFFNGTQAWVTGWNTNTNLDVGGPLVIKQEGRWIQAGIMIYPGSCYASGYVEVYTRVSLHQNWINQQIISNQPGFVTFTSIGTNGDLSVSCPGLSPVATSYPVTSTSAALCKIACIYNI
ncbi:chymotrypsinogen A-like [Colossoma macropomum]|uniref:chymotrypsinogen A-like n=1 Tax=Colossoma macropomum TaxID=42526 RepID=UPI001863FF8E|nr:chymotrypsinogen A-like [Colossoma macropomum]